LAFFQYSIFKEQLTRLIKDQSGGTQMSFFNLKIIKDRRSGKDRRKSNSGRKSGIERRSGKDRRMNLYDRLHEDQRNTVEIIIKHLERQAG
jgi:hypothetical protein